MDYSEILMQSVDVLINKRVSELEFDKTIICTVVDASSAAKGEYQVTDGATTFVAYSKDVTFKVDDSVYVTIPNGDYGNQKLIVGKHVGQGEDLIYLSPLDSFINVTGDLCNLTSTTSLLANSTEIVTNNGQSFINPIRKTIWKADIPTGKCFERLGIQADFKTWLKKLKVNSGNYGLCLYVFYVDKGTVNSQDSPPKVESFIFDSKSMYGNPYNYESFYTQQIVFDISHITGQITHMELVFYQEANFGTTTGNSAPTVDSTNGKPLADNIFVKNIHIGLGYDISKFNEDTVMLYCMNESTYNHNNSTQENRKTIHARWIRVTNEGIYSVDSADEIPENAKIHWYRYQLKIQDQTDELAGPLWFEIEDAVNQLKIEVDPDTSELTQMYKVVIEAPSTQWILEQLDENENAEYRALKISAELANDDESEEKQALDMYMYNIESQRKIYRSEPIEFKSEVPVVDKMTADLINGLKIIVDEAGYKGNYLLYNTSNKIQNTNEASRMRVMKASYQSLVTGEKTLDGAESIVWKIPLQNTMIYGPEDGKEYNSKDAATSYWEEGGFAYIKRMSGNSNSGSIGTVNDWSCEQKFRIKAYYQQSATNNTVYCYVIKNNVAYEASSEMTFGPMGSNGTDFTFRMSFDSDIPGVMPKPDGSRQILRVNLSMFDFNNDKVPNFWDSGVKISWYHQDENKAISFWDIDNQKEITDSLMTIYDKEFYIAYNPQKGIPNASIIKAQVSSDPTVGAGTNTLSAVRLTSYLLIPYRSNASYSGIEGATMILYNSGGTSPDYYKERYRLWQTTADAVTEVSGITWKIFSPEEGPKPKFFPYLTEAYALVPPSIYVEMDAEQVSGRSNRNIFVQALDAVGNVLWSQPIMMERDAYTSTMLNAWDGNLTIDEKNGTILSTMIGAGKKDQENRFNGVLMGDVTDAISNLNLIGLYGFSQGVQSFGWKIDGTGFIGKSGQGQIIFDGNRGTISSGIWKNSKKTIGMEIDLDGPTPTGANWNSTGSTLKAYGASGRIDIDTSETSQRLFRVQGRTAATLAETDSTKWGYQDMIKISLDIDKAYSTLGTDEVSIDTSFYIQSLGYKAGETGTRLDLQNGYFYSFGKYGRIQFSTGNNTFFRLADADNKVLFVIKNSTDSDGAAGTDATPVVSQYYIQSSNFSSSDHTGTRLDLAKGKYTSYGAHGRIEIAPDTSTFFRLADADNHVLFIIKNPSSGDADGSGDTSSYYLQSSNFNAGKNIGTKFDLKNGKYTSYGSSGAITISSNGNNLFQVRLQYGTDDAKQYCTLMNIGVNSYYIQNKDYATTSGTKGSKWNLVSGHFDAKGDGGSIAIHPDNANALFKVATSADKTLINIGSGNYYLQSADYVAGGDSGFKLDLSTGDMVGSNFSISLTKGNNKLIVGSKSNTNAIEVLQNGAQRFAVHWDGSVVLSGSATLTVKSGIIQSGGTGGDGKYYKLTQNGGVIGGWKIDEDKICNADDPDDIALYASGKMYMKDGSQKMSLTSEGLYVGNGHSTVKLSSDGIVYSTGGASGSVGTTASFEVNATHLSFGSTVSGSWGSESHSFEVTSSKMTGSGFTTLLLQGNNFSFKLGTAGNSWLASNSGLHICANSASGSAPTGGRLELVGNDIYIKAANGSNSLLFWYKEGWHHITYIVNDILSDNGSSEEVSYDPGVGTSVKKLCFTNGIFTGTK